MKSSIPAARQRSRSSTVALAVSATIGRRSPRARSCRVASKPSISGMWQSISTTSKRCDPGRQGLGAVLRDDHAMPVALQHGDRDRGVDRVVLGQQDVQAAPGRATAGGVAGPAAAASGWPVDQRQRQVEPERAAVAGLARHADLPPISSTSCARDGQAEAGAAEAARHRAVGLVERLEQAVQRVRRDADAGVGDLDAHRRRRRPPLPRVDSRSVTPPRSVNLTALPSRLISTCRSRCGSPSMGGSGTRGRSARRPGPCASPPARRSPAPARARRPARRGRSPGAACPPRSSRNRGCR